MEGAREPREVALDADWPREWSTCPSSGCRPSIGSNYQPDNAMLAVAGKFDPGRAIQLIEAKFASIPRPTRTGAAEIFATYTRSTTSMRLIDPSRSHSQ